MVISIVSHLIIYYGVKDVPYAANLRLKTMLMNTLTRITLIMSNKSTTRIVKALEGDYFLLITICQSIILVWKLMDNTIIFQKDS